jgi:recombinational DNA repair ATPase RecF
LLLLDDVMSELDPGRRELLVARLATGGQTLITAADEESLPSPARESMVRMPSPGVVDTGSVDQGAGDSGAEAA